MIERRGLKCLNCDSCDERIAMIERRGLKRLNRDSCDERIAMIKRIKRVNSEQDRRSCAMWANREGWKIGRMEDWKDGRLRRGRKRLNRDSCDERIAMIKSGGSGLL